MYLKLGAAGLVLALAPLVAADFWENKEFTEWSDKQVRRILEDSPWARPVSISDDRPGGGSAGIADASKAAERNNRNSSTAPAAPRSVTAILRWHTALPVKQAVARMRFGAEAGTSAEAAKMLSPEDDRYVLGLANVPAGLLRGDPAGLRNAIFLKLKNKPPIPVADVQGDRRGDRVNLFLIFPRGQQGSPVIEPGDGEVEVEIKLESTKVTRKFKLADMMFRGKLEI